MTKAWCPILPKDLSEDVINEAFPGMANPACQDYTSLETRAAEQLIADSSWKDLINLNGIPIWYYVYGFDTERSDKIFGEDILAKYQEPFELKVYLEIKDVPKILGPYGGMYSDDSVTGYIHIKTFEDTVKDKQYFKDLKLRFEPKPQDLIQIITFGCDRPGDRSANYYEITNKEDQLITDQMNLAYGHYVWKFAAKRYMFSYEGGSVEEFGESGNCQLYDNFQEGKIQPSQKIEEMLPDKAYDFNIDKESKEKIFNQNIKNQDDIYGGYYS